MKPFYILFAFLFSIIATNSLSQSWQVVWDNQLENNKADFYSDVIEDKDRGFIVFGSILTSGNSNDFWLVAYNEKGDTVWTKTLGTKFRDVPKKIVQMANGGFLLVGATVQENTERLLLLRTDNNGNEQWRKTINDGNYYLGEDVAALEDDGFVLVGAKGSEIGDVKLWMAKMDSKGEFIWEKTFHEELFGCIKSIKKLPIGGFSVSGQVNEKGKKDCDILIMRTNDNGELKWSTRMKSPGKIEWPACVCCSPDSCFVLVGWRGVCFNDINSEDAIFDYDVILNKIDCNGKVQWTKNFDSEGSEGGNAVVIRPNGNFLVAGIKATSFLGNIGSWLISIDPEGNKLDEKLIKFRFRNDQAIKVINCSDGGFVVIGPGLQEDSNKRSDGWIMKFSTL
jgi:hypothetical protein